MTGNDLSDEKIEGIGIPTAVAGVETRREYADSPKECVEALRRVGVFADLPEEQLRWFIENCEEVVLEAGEVLFRKGDAPEWMAIYLEGEMHAYRDEQTHDGYVYIARAGDAATEVSGMLPFSRMTEWGATGRAVVKTRVLLLNARHFPELLQRMPILAQRLVGIMTDRVRETTKEDQTRDKLMALGKLSAGLAHELNNPAAAATRAANDLLAALEELRRADLDLCRHNLSARQREIIREFEAAAIIRAETAASFNPLEQSDREDEISDWLDRHEIADGWKLAALLVEAGIDTSALETIAAALVETESLGDVLARTVAQLSAARLAGDIKNSTARISELVGAIKEYTYMDKAAVQTVDLRQGLENTLLILKYKLRKKNVAVEREYAEDLPRVEVYGSELNQVWTNLIDNAIDALEDGGTLKIRTKREPTDVLIEIRDDGAGIPENLQTKIFEPFFTTKTVGEGTGLGLDTVARIVRKHRGNLRVESKPGDTCFQIRLPLNQKK